MQNLAGNKDCDIIIRQELEEARIPIVAAYKSDSDVPYKIRGELFGWEIHRYWYYYSAHANLGLPYPVAVKLYEMDKDKVIRASGDCAVRHPDEWSDDYNMDGYHVIKMPEKDTKEVFERMKLEHGAYSWDKDTEYRYIDCYHIDSQDGLNIFANFIRETHRKMYNALSLS